MEKSPSINGPLKSQYSYDGDAPGDGGFFEQDRGGDGYSVVSDYSAGPETVEAALTTELEVRSEASSDANVLLVEKLQARLSDARLDHSGSQGRWGDVVDECSSSSVDSRSLGLFSVSSSDDGDHGTFY